MEPVNSKTLTLNRSLNIFLSEFVRVSLSRASQPLLVTFVTVVFR